MENTNHKPSRSEKSGFDEASKKNGSGKSAEKQENQSENEGRKLSDYPEGNLDETQSQTDSIPGNQTDQPEADE